MKRAKILTTLLCMALAFGAPLFAQDALESEMEQIAEDARNEAAAANQHPEASAEAEEAAEPEELAEAEAAAEPQKKAKGMPMSEKPKRFFEIGFDGNGGVTNNAFGFSDLFRKEIVLDIPAIRDNVGSNGMNFALAPLSGNVFFNINIGQLFGFGVFAKMEGDISLTLGSALLDFLADGNINNRNPNGEAVSVSGGIFMSTGLRGFLHLDRWTFTASPAAFLPIVYIPKSSLTYTLNTVDAFELYANGEINVYTPFSMEDANVAESMSGSSKMGFDLSIGAEFGLFDWLYLGGTANNIPIVPSTLTNQMTIKGDALGITMKDPLSNPEIETNTEVEQVYADDASETVRRPLTFDVYAKWQLLDKRFLKLTLKPNLGFTALTASGAANFNWGLQADASLLFLSLQVGTGLNQGIWKHRAGLGINLRVLELLFEASLQSTDFLGSFNASGLGLGVGFRFGF